MTKGKAYRALRRRLEQDIIAARAAGDEQRADELEQRCFHIGGLMAAEIYHQNREYESLRHAALKYYPPERYE
jgi:hypothetical protein